MSYNGLAIVIDQPSRFDLDQGKLLAGPAREWMENITGLNINECFIAAASQGPISFPTSTKHIALLGAQASLTYGLTSNDPPGYPLFVRNSPHNQIIPAIAAFDPQDCNDIRYMGDLADDEYEDKLTERDTKEATPTRRKNRRFWTAWHLNRLLHPSPTVEQKPIIIVAPNLQEATAALDGYSGVLYLDIETSRLHRCITCVGFSTDVIFPRVYVVPYYLHTGERAYHNLWKFHVALARAFTRCVVVAHNSAFDISVLHHWYKIPIPGKYGGGIYDTMVANHRTFPEIEKALGHVISMWTRQHNHKNVATEVFNEAQERILWDYNGRDVYNLRLIMRAQMDYAIGVPGLTASVTQANASLPAYIDTSFIGMPIDLGKLAANGRRLSREKRVLTRIAAQLTGKPLFNPGSTKQCIAYIHDFLHYPVQAKTDKGAPSLGSKQLYQLLTKYNNPLLKVLLRYRGAAKDYGSLESELL